MMQSRRTPLTLWRLPKVLEVTGLKKTQIFEAVAQGRFPAPIRILENGRAIAWLDTEIISFIEARVAARDRATRIADTSPRQPANYERALKAKAVAE